MKPETKYLRGSPSKTYLKKTFNGATPTGQVHDFHVSHWRVKKCPEVDWKGLSRKDIEAFKAATRAKSEGYAPPSRPRDGGNVPRRATPDRSGIAIVPEMAFLPTWVALSPQIRKLHFFRVDSISTQISRSEMRDGPTFVDSSVRVKEKRWGGKKLCGKPAVKARWIPLETSCSRLDSELVAPRAADNFIGASNTFRAVQAV